MHRKNLQLSKKCPEDIFVEVLRFLPICVFYLSFLHRPSIRICLQFFIIGDTLTKGELGLLSSLSQFFLAVV